MKVITTRLIQSKYRECRRFLICRSYEEKKSNSKKRKRDTEDDSNPEKRSRTERAKEFKGSYKNVAKASESEAKPAKKRAKVSSPKPYTTDAISSRQRRVLTATAGVKSSSSVPNVPSLTILDAHVIPV